MYNKLIAPAPWKLKGNGLVLLYLFPKGFITDFGFMTNFQHQGYRAGMGAVMLMNYTESNVGPYQELLFLPGFFKIGNKWGFSVSKIYVSTGESACSGRRNWGLNKELAGFGLTENTEGHSIWKVWKDGKLFFETAVKMSGISFPFTSRLMPLSRIIQRTPQELLLTNPVAYGRIRPANIKSVRSEAAFFPPVGELRPLAAFSLPDFSMKFPTAQYLQPQ